MRILALALAISGWAVAAIAAPASLSPDQMRQAAVQAMALGDAAAALALADALLQRDAADPAALIVKSRALRAMGQYRASRKAAHAAWRVARTDDEKYMAALGMAQALASSERRTAAQFWLRRAAQVAPNDRASAIARRDFGYVKSRNPLVLKFDFGLTPSSNINNGTSATRLGIFELLGSARALSGVEATTGFSARYRLPPSSNAASELKFSALGRHYWLSDEARAQAPDARASDYSFAAVELGASTRQRTDDGTMVFSFGATLGHNRYGGRRLSDYLQLDAGAERAFTPGTTGLIGLSLERQVRHDSARRSANIAGIRTGVIRQLANHDRLQFTLGTRMTAAQASEVDHRALTARLDWDKASPIAGVRFGAGLSAEARDYARSAFSSNGRQDLRLSADLSLVLERFDYMGFSPSLDLQITRNSSNISLYESSETGVTLGIRSSF